MKLNRTTRGTMLAAFGLLALASGTAAAAGPAGYAQLTNGQVAPPAPGAEGEVDLHGGVSAAPAMSEPTTHPAPMPDPGMTYGAMPGPVYYGDGYCPECEAEHDHHHGMFSWLHRDRYVGGVDPNAWTYHDGSGHGSHEHTSGDVINGAERGTEWLMHRLHTRYGYFWPTGGAGYGIPWAGGYWVTYPTNPGYFDHRDGQVYSAQGYGAPMAVPLAPNVDHTYNYGWGLPSSRLTPVSRRVPQGNYVAPLPYANVYDAIEVND